MHQYKALDLANKAERFPVNSPKRNRILRRVLRVYAAYWRIALDPKIERKYAQLARKF